MMAAHSLSATHPLHEKNFDPFRDRIREQVDLSKTNWFRVGGPAEFLFKPQDSNDLAAFLALLPLDIPVTVLGVGSNVIVRDAGIEGVVIKLGRGFASISPSPLRGEGGVGVNPASTESVTPTPEMLKNDIHMSFFNISASPPQGGENYVTEAGAAALDVNVAQFACEHGVAGLEFLSGIPGTIGGAVRMNGGAYGSDISHTLVEAEIVERSGNIRRVSKKELGFSYRHSALPEGAIVTKAWLQGVRGDKKIIAQKMQEIAQSREDTQPIRTRTGGSTFKNPPNNQDGGHKAWELIERAGCRGLTIGGAQVSEKHCNFFINTGDATAHDIEALGEEVRRRVKEKTGITLEWEIRRIGKTL